MKHMNITLKRLILYVVGLFFLSLGISFSIQANLGISPASSFAYAISLTTTLSIGVTTVLTNVFFIVLQVVITRRIDLRDFAVQLLVAFLFGFYMDLTLFLLRLFPTPETLMMRSVFIIISLFVVAIGLTCYFTAKFPLLPYDALTYVISDHFKIPFSKAKVGCDLANVVAAGTLCLSVIHSFGSIGIGTLLAALFIGKIVGWMMKKFQPSLIGWVKKAKVAA